jgi:uncharacterized protein (UPF0332 family)
MTVSTREGKSRSAFMRADANLADAYQLHADKVPGVLVQTVYRAVLQAAKAVLLFLNDGAPPEADKVFLEFFNALNAQGKPQTYGEQVRFVQNLFATANYDGNEGVESTQADDVRTFAKEFLGFCAGWIGVSFDATRFATQTS